MRHERATHRREMQPAYINYEGVSRMQAAGLGPTSPLLSSRAMKFSSYRGPDLRDTRAHAKPYRSTVPRIFHAEAGAARATKVRKSEKKLSVLDELGPRTGAARRDVEMRLTIVFEINSLARRRRSRCGRDWMVKKERHNVKSKEWSHILFKVKKKLKVYTYTIFSPYYSIKVFFMKQII